MKITRQEFEKRLDALINEALDADLDFMIISVSTQPDAKDVQTFGVMNGSGNDLGQCFENIIGEMIKSEDEGSEWMRHAMASALLKNALYRREKDVCDCPKCVERRASQTRH